MSSGNASTTPPIGRSDDTPVDEAHIRKIEKLFAKAHATANPHESEAFARKAAELAARHRVDPDRLAAADRDELGIRTVELGRGAYVRARLALLSAVAEHHDAMVVFKAGASGTVALVAGFESDLDVIEVMYQSLHQQAARQMAAIRRPTGAATQRYRRSFLFGFADRIAQQLDEARRMAEAGMASGSSARSQSAALALRERGARVAEHADRVFGRTRVARPPAAAQAGGWRAGSAAADRVDLGRTRLAGRKALNR